MQYEDQVRSFVWAHKECGRNPAVTRVAGAGIPSREISSLADIAELANLVTQASNANPKTSLHLNIFPAQTERYGIYLDLDPVLKSRDRLIAPEATRIELDKALITIVSGFIKVYVAHLVQAHLNNKALSASSSSESQTDFQFQALYAGRPVLEEREKDGDMYCYKHGCHVYIGEIQAYQSDHIIAFDKAVTYFNSPAADGHETVAMLLSRYNIPRDKISKVFDPNITASRSVLVPGCRKKDGHVTYYPSMILSYTLSISGDRPFVYLTGTRDYCREPLQRFFPIHIGKQAFEVTGALNMGAVPLPAIPEPDLDKLEEHELLEEAKMRNDSAAQIMMLAGIIPFDKISDQANGHMYRLKIINAIVYGIVPETQRAEWARRIVKWCFNRNPVPSGSDWSTESHIAARVDDAINEGKHVDIGWLRTEAALVDQTRVHEITELFRSRNIVELLRRLHSNHSRRGNRRCSCINHQEGADLFFRVIGDNYREFSGSSSRERRWYRYTEDAKPHFSCKKWREVPDIKAMIMYDIERTLNPLLDKIARESATGSIMNITATATSFDQYVLDVKDALGNETFINGLVTYLASKYVHSGSEFARELDMLPDLTGCLNGILKFESHPFRVTLLDGNNRDLPVSRSLDASYRTDFTDDSPAVKKIFSIFREIIPNRDELDYFLTANAGIILSGRCGGEKFFILYGSGGDGKSTIMNALVSLAGKSSSGSFRGYGVEGDPRIFQYEKKDPNGHDGGSIFLYGGPRIGNFPEPSGEHPYLVESVIKSKLSGSSQPARDLHQSAQSLEFRVVPYILTNDQLEFKGTVTVGGQRRILCLIFTEKFKPKSEMAKYLGKRGFHQIDPELIGIFTKGKEGKELREALLWVLITKYLPRFYDDCNADINSIPVPIRYEAITASFFGRHSNIMVAFMNAKMDSSEGSRIPMSEFMTVFTSWHRTTQRGSIRDLVQKKTTQKSPDLVGPAVRDPWTHEVLHIISSSPLGSDMAEKNGDDYAPIGPNEMIMANSANLYINGWKWKKSESTVVAAAASDVSTILAGAESSVAPESHVVAATAQ